MASGGPAGNASGGFRSTGYPQPRQPSYMTQASSSSSVMGDAFTPQMRDRQARGKDPYHSADGSEASDLSDRETAGAGAGARMRPGSGRYVLPPPQHPYICNVKRINVGSARFSNLDKEDFSRAERRHKATIFLDTPELLMMHAQSTGDVSLLPSTREDIIS